MSKTATLVTRAGHVFEVPIDPEPTDLIVRYDREGIPIRVFVRSDKTGSYIERDFGLLGLRLPDEGGAGGGLNQINPFTANAKRVAPSQMCIHAPNNVPHDYVDGECRYCGRPDFG